MGDFDDDSNAPPTVNLSTKPTQYGFGDSVDVSVDASDSNGNVTEVCAEATRTNTTATQQLNQSCRTTSSSNITETFTDLFTVSDRGYNYTVSVNATDNAGATTTDSKTRTIGNTAFTDAFNVLGQNVGAFNVTIDGETKTRGDQFITAQSFNATFSKQGFFDKTASFTEGLNKEFTGVGNHERTVNASEIRNGLKVNNFTAQITGPNNFQDTKTVTDGNATFQIIQNETYTLSIPDTNENDTFATRFNNGSLIMEKDITPTTKQNTTSFETFTYNSVDFSVFDINQPNKVLQQQVNISLINGPEDRELTSTNGSLFADDLLTGDYTARIQSQNFTNNDYFFDVSEASFQRIDAYLDTQTTEIFFTVVDSQRNEIQDAVITMNHKVNGSLQHFRVPISGCGS